MYGRLLRLHRAETAPFCENPPEWIGGLRDAGVTTPLLLLLAARGERRLGVAALNASADDFILPPLSMAEFVARARALARRNGGFAAQALTWGDVTLDTQTFELRTAVGRVHLGNREYQIIELLMRGRGRRIAAEEIARRVWGEENAGSELIWVHISALRKAGSNRSAGENPHLSRAGVRAGGLKPIILSLEKNNKPLLLTV